MFLKFYRKKLKYILNFPSGIKTIIWKNDIIQKLRICLINQVIVNFTIKDQYINTTFNLLFLSALTFLNSNFFSGYVYSLNNIASGAR